MPKISALAAQTALTSDDLFVVVDAPSGTPSTKKITSAIVQRDTQGGIAYTWPGANAAGSLVNDGNGVLSWSASGGGSVTSVALTVPTGLSVSGSPVTGAGTLAVTYAAGYAIPTTAKQTEWDTAYGWGNHASAGYLTSETSHADVVVDGDFTSNGILKRTSAGVYGIVTDNSANWDTAYGWGNHALAGYLTSETSHADVVVDGDFTSDGLLARSGGSGSYTIVTNNSANWNTAYGWGNHAGLYDAAGTAASALSGHTTTYNHANYDTAYSWGNHATAGYLTSLAFDGLSDVTITTQALGDLVYASSGSAWVNLAGNTTTTKKFLRQTGNGSISAAPAWDTVTATDVGLGNVENTALSTWAGSANILTVGTIGTGVWQGTAVGLGYGGTGFTTYAAGDLIYASALNTLAKRTIGNTGDVLTVSGGVPVWAAPTAGTPTFTTQIKTTYTGGAQLLLEYDASNYLSVNVSSGGIPTLTASGGYYIFGGGAASAYLRVPATTSLYLTGATIAGGTGTTRNSAFGFGAGDSNTAGDDETAIGYNALTASTSNRNTAVGASAAAAIAGSSDSNTVVGYNALLQGLSCVENVIIGARAAEDSNASKNYNVVIGAAAGYSMSTADGNVLIGRNAGRGASALTTGDYCIGIGYQVYFSSATGSYQLNIGDFLTAADYRNEVTFASKVIAKASTTSYASLNIPSGTAPTSPVDGDIWSDGSDIKIRLSGVTYTLTKA